MRAACLTLLFCLAACAEFPTLDNQISDADRAAPYPRLTSVDAVLAQARATGPTQNTVASDVASRVANLTSRANSLRSGIIESQIRARMQRGVDTSALR